MKLVDTMYDIVLTSYHYSFYIIYQIGPASGLADDCIPHGLDK